MKIGLHGGMEIRNANFTELLLPAVFAVLIAIIIVYLGKLVLIRMPGIRPVDAIATAGLFGAFSASTFAAAMLHFSILMIIMGIEAWQRLAELRRVAHWYAVYAVLAPLVHGAIAFGFGAIAHHLNGFSPGGVVLLAILAASSSDISGPPTLRAGIPTANPSTYIGSSTSIGTPICIAIGILLVTELAKIAF
jgi:hypothetical protein